MPSFIISFSLGKMLQTGLVKICLPIMLQWKSGGLGELLCRKEGSQFLGQLTCVMGEKMTTNSLHLVVKEQKYD